MGRDTCVCNPSSGARCASHAASGLPAKCLYKWKYIAPRDNCLCAVCVSVRGTLMGLQPTCIEPGYNGVIAPRSGCVCDVCLPRITTPECTCDYAENGSHALSCAIYKPRLSNGQMSVGEYARRKDQIEREYSAMRIDERVRTQSLIDLEREKKQRNGGIRGPYTGRIPAPPPKRVALTVVDHMRVKELYTDIDNLLGGLDKQGKLPIGLYQVILARMEEIK